MKKFQYFSFLFALVFGFIFHIHAKEIAKITQFDYLGYSTVNDLIFIKEEIMEVPEKDFIWKVVHPSNMNQELAIAIFNQSHRNRPLKASALRNKSMTSYEDIDALRKKWAGITEKVKATKKGKHKEPFFKREIKKAYKLEKFKKQKKCSYPPLKESQGLKGCYGRNQSTEFVVIQEIIPYGTPRELEFQKYQNIEKIIFLK